MHSTHCKVAVRREIKLALYGGIQLLHIACYRKKKDTIERLSI